MNKYKTLLVNLGLFALNTVATKLISFLLVPLYTYYMNSSQFGITDMATTVISLVTPLATLSFSEATLRFAMEYKEQNRQYITVGLMVLAFSCVIVMCLLPALNLNIFGGLGDYRWMFLLCYISSAFQSFFNNVSRAVNEIKIIPVASVATAATTGVLAFLLIGKVSMGVDGYFWSMIIGNVVGILIYLFGARLHRFITSIRWQDFAHNFRSMIHYSLPLIPNALFWWAGTSINRFFITSMLGIGFSGLFAAASKIPTLLNIICGIFQQAWTLSAFQEYRNEGVSNFFTKIFRIYQSGLIFSASAIVVLAPWISSFMLQKEFYDSWTLIPVFLVAFYFNTMNTFYGTIFTSSMKTRPLFTTTVCGAAVIVVGTYLLIPPLGLVGACVAMALGNFVVLILRMILSRNLITVKVHWPTVAPSVLVFLVQVVIMSQQIPHYMLYSIGLFGVITVIQIIDLLPTAKELLGSLKRKKLATKK